MGMRFYDLNSFYIISDIQEHKENKEKLLSLIGDMEDTGCEGITKTDWHLPKETPRPYLDFCYSMISPYLTKISERIEGNKWYIHNGWFQQYAKREEHGWHTHGECNFANVYFLDLPDESMKTQFYDITERKIMNEIDVKEGQLLTFPAHILHRSPPNTSDSVKTIISFNCDFYSEF